MKYIHIGIFIFAFSILKINSMARPDYGSMNGHTILAAHTAIYNNNPEAFCAALRRDMLKPAGWPAHIVKTWECFAWEDPEGYERGARSVLFAACYLKHVMHDPRGQQMIDFLTKKHDFLAGIRNLPNGNLIDFGASFHNAFTYYCPETIKVLLQECAASGVDLNKQIVYMAGDGDSWKKETILTCLLKESKRRYAIKLNEVMPLFISHGASLDARNEDGKSANDIIKENGIAVTK